ncbi:MAG: molybdenum cofactor guanylyltransferase [Anaerolineae bacterium]|nr:molybdenum cofactor guanylyltransferase [Anaerolineae bacterium]
MTTPVVSGAIIAGGSSRRMGRDKRLLPIAGRPLITHPLDVLRQITATPMIIANDSQMLRAVGIAAPILPDVIPNAGAMGGIFTALHASSRQWVLCVAADMPRLNADLLRNMCQRIDSAYDVVLPVVGDEQQGLHALYRRTALPLLRQKIEAGDVRLQGIFQELRVLRLTEADILPFDPALESFVNINTPDDYQLYKDG